MRRVVLWAALLGAWAAPATALADTPPSVWDIARDPAERARWTLHVRVHRLFDAPGVEDDAAGEPRLDAELRLEAARAMLEQADAAHSPDVRLRFDLGIVDYSLGDRQGGRKDLFQKAVDILAPAIDSAPDHPAAVEAMATLVIAYAKLNRPRDELAAWRRYIPRLTDESRRVEAMMNMGEAEMRLGLVDDALGTFREVLRMCGDLPNAGNVSMTYVLTLWDLAVALDRSGDPRGAFDTAAQASRMNAVGSTNALVSGAALVASDPGVFFVPEWEREWYLALASSVAARDARDARDAATAWRSAEAHWDAYLERAAAGSGRDPWIAIARLRRARVEVERTAAERRAAKLPRRPEPERSYTP